MHSTTQYQARRHPVAAFLALLIISPYVLAFVAVVAALLLISAGLDALAKRR